VRKTFGIFSGTSFTLTTNFGRLRTVLDNYRSWLSVLGRRGESLRIISLSTCNLGFMVQTLLSDLISNYLRSVV
jgi:hypothetical protein